MIFESFPWKQDLRRRKNLIIKYNTAEHFEKNDDTTYTVIEKAIFYSAFIIRKLMDCGGKLSDESENYSLKVCSVQPLKPVDRLHRWPEEDSHDWENEKEVVVTGKNVCNWLILDFCSCQACPKYKLTERQSKRSLWWDCSWGPNNPYWAPVAAPAGGL